jgi:integrase
MRGGVFKRCRCRDQETGKDVGSKCPLLKRKGHGTWWFRYEAPRGADGQRRRPLVGPFTTQDDAEEALAAELARMGGGGHVQDRSILVSGYMGNWLAAKKLELKPKTYASYLEAVSLYFNPAFGHMRLVELRDHHVQELVQEMLKINRSLPETDRPSEMLRRLIEARADDVRRDLPPGEKRHKKSTRPLSPARVRRVIAVLNAALNDAVPRKISFNPVESVKLPRIKQKVKPRVWTAEREARWRADLHKRLALARELRKHSGKRTPTALDVWRSTPRPSPVMVWLPEHTGRFLDFIEGERLYALFHLTAFTGLRRAEVVWLAWAEVDLDEGVLYIRETREDDDSDPDDPKSQSGDRTVPLDAVTIAVLRAWRKHQADERLALGPGWVDTGLVFTREDGTALSPQGVSARFESLAYRSGLPAIRFHDLRHGAASLSKAAGQDTKIISELLGHNRTSFTDDVYTNVFPDVAKAAAEARAAVVPRSRPRPDDGCSEGAPQVAGVTGSGQPVTSRSGTRSTS